MIGSSEGMNQEISDCAVVACYHRCTLRIANFKLKDSIDYFVHYSLSAIADITLTKANDSYSIDELAVTLSDFPRTGESLHTPDYREKLGLPV